MPRRAQLRSRPGVGDRQVPGHVHQALARGHRPGEQRPAPATRSPSRWDDYCDDQPGRTPWPQTGELSHQSAKQYRIEVLLRRQRDRPPARGPGDLHRARPSSTPRARSSGVSRPSTPTTTASTWSATKQLVKQSPAGRADARPIEQRRRSPAPRRSAGQPQAFATSYDIEIYAQRRHHVLVRQRGSRPATGVRTAAFTPSEPLPASEHRLRLARASHRRLRQQGAVVGSRARFTVTAGSVTLLAPPLGASVPPNGRGPPVEPVVGRGDVQRRRSPLSGSAPRSAPPRSPRAYAPLAYLHDGRLPVDGHGPGRERQRRSGGHAPPSPSTPRSRPSRRPAIETPEGTGVGKTLTVPRPAWNIGGVDVTTPTSGCANGSRITGATGTSYTLATDDFGKSITVRATGKKARLPRRRQRPACRCRPTSGDAVNNMTPPTITGSPDAWATTSPATRAPGRRPTATSTSLRVAARRRRPSRAPRPAYYQVTAADGGHAIAIRVTATATGYSDGVPTPAAGDRDPSADRRRSTISAPSGTGVGASLVGAAPTWNQARRRPPPTSGSATGSAIVGRQRGHLHARPSTTSARRSPSGRPAEGRASRTASSISNGVVATAGGALQATVRPSISGTAAVGQHAQRRPGHVDRQPPPTFTYQWLRNGAPIPGATQRDLPAHRADAAARNVSVTRARRQGRLRGRLGQRGSRRGRQAEVDDDRMPCPPSRVKRRVAGQARRSRSTVPRACPARSASLVIKDGKKTLKKLTLSRVQEGRDHLQAAQAQAGQAQADGGRTAATATSPARSRQARPQGRAGESESRAGPGHGGQ